MRASTRAVGLVWAAIFVGCFSTTFADISVSTLAVRRPVPVGKQNAVPNYTAYGGGLPQDAGQEYPPPYGPYGYPPPSPPSTSTTVSESSTTAQASSSRGQPLSTTATVSPTTATTTATVSETTSFTGSSTSPASLPLNSTSSAEATGTAESSTGQISTTNSSIPATFSGSGTVSSATVTAVTTSATGSSSGSAGTTPSSSVLPSLLSTPAPPSSAVAPGFNCELYIEWSFNQYHFDNDRTRRRRPWRPNHTAGPIYYNQLR